MTMIDTSKIDRMDLRREVLALDATRKVLAAAVDAADAAMEYAIAAEVDREEEIYNRKETELRRAFQNRCVEIRIAHGGGDKSADEALDEHDRAEAYGDVAGFDDDSQSVRCVLTGLPILEDDETVEDSEGRRALAAAITGWPSFDVVESDADAEDAA